MSCPVAFAAWFGSGERFEVYGTEGSATWTFERMNELQLYLAGDELESGYTRVLAGERFPYHGSFVPGSANGIGYEDLVTIEDEAFCTAIVERRPFGMSLGQERVLIRLRPQ